MRIWTIAQPASPPIVQRLGPRHYSGMPILSPKPGGDSAKKRMERYCASHPGSPAAVERPRLTHRNNVWVALGGRSVQEGIVGLGRTVEAALRAFDLQHDKAFRPRTA